MLMIIKATVNQADYANIVRTFWLKEEIEADLQVDGIAYPAAKIAFCGQATSLNYPKKGFKIVFRKKQLYQGHTRRLDLSAGYPDKSLIRQRLSFDLLARSGVTASKSWPVDFSIFNKEGHLLARALFTGLEHVDEYFFGQRQQEIGTLYQANGGVVNGLFVGAVLEPQPDNILKILYDKEHASPLAATGLPARLASSLVGQPSIEIAAGDEEDYSDLADFIRAINSWDAATISRFMDSVLDVERYLAWLAVNTLVQSNNTYHKNYFLHRRLTDNKWEIIPWNYDLSWGRNWNDACGGLCDDLSEATSIKGSAQMVNRLSQRVLQNPTYYERLRVKLADLLGGAFSEERLYAQIEAAYAEIRNLAYQDSRKWPTNQQFEQERDRLKDWIRRRRRFLFKELGVVAGIAALPQKLPDTIVTAVGFNKAPLVSGDQLVFEATVRNIGSAATGPTVGVAFQVDGHYLTFGTSAALQPGESRAIKAVSPWTAVAGAHTLTAIVDDVNRYPEISESNNSLSSPFQVVAQPAPLLSDVLVKDIAFERNEAGQFQLAALVANVGPVVTPAVVGVAFLVDDVFATYGVGEPMPAGETKAIRAVRALPLIGLRRVTAIVDDVNRFPEQSEQNNSRTEMIDFGTVAPKLADTLILEVNLGREGRFSEGEAITFEALVQNIGSAPTGPVVGVAFSVNGQYVTFGNTISLAPSETRRIRSVSTWRAMVGRHRLLAVADDVNRYPELSEENNRFEMSFEILKREAIKLPDSTVDSLDYDNDSAGRAILTATVSNIGTAATPEVVGVAFFVDGRFTTFGTTAPMAPATQTTIRAVQPLALEGKHLITAIVDDVNRYDELSHQNNKLEREISFTARRVERRALWVTRYDWTTVGKAPAPEAVDEIVSKAATAGFNALFFQVRGSGDAYYTPGLEPWAARLTGSLAPTLGQNPGWDPLARLLAKAKVAGLEVHAYLNIYPIWIAPPNQTYGQLAPPATRPPHLFDRLTYGPTFTDHPGEHALGNQWRQHDQAGQPMPLAWGETLWASPGVEPVQSHTLAVMADVVRRYAVDGLHLDLIRYANRPYSFDPLSNAAAGEQRTPQRDQWQRDRITDLVRRAQAQIKSIRPGVLLSAAVWPYYQNKWGWRVSQGYSDYYQDSKGWLAAGIADAIAPMMYGADADDFDKWQILLKDFLADSHGRHIYPAINGDYEDFNAITQRIEAARQAGAPGHAIFSYGALNRRGYWEKLAAGPYAQPARLPGKLSFI